MIKWPAFPALIFGLCTSTAAFALDSAHYVCSAVAEFGGGNDGKIGISIVFDDVRARSGNGRDYFLSSIYQRKLFQGQGSKLDDSAPFGAGKVTLKNAKSTLFDGSFKVDQGQDNSFTMSLDGKINQDPGAGNKLSPIKVTLPCVDLSI